MLYDNLISYINSGEMDSKLIDIYQDKKELETQKKRYINAIESFKGLYPELSDISIFSAPGRTEIGGNHTDHQHGQVLAASINLDAIAVASKRIQI